MTEENRMQQAMQNAHSAAVGPVLQAMQEEVDAFCQMKGWRENGGVSFGEAMALLHSEVSEALEAYRKQGLARMIRFSDGEIHPADDLGIIHENMLKVEDGKPEGVGSEFADVLIRLLDDCALFGVDLAAEYRRKMDYNWTRAYRHGGKRL